MTSAHQLEDKVAYAYGAIGFGLVMIQAGDAVRGVQLVGAGEAWSEAIGIEMVLISQKAAALAHARAALGDEAFAAALAAGRARLIEDVVAELARDQQ